MSIKLKNNNGKVAFLLRTGKHLVRNEMAVASAEHIIATGKVVESTEKDYPICVDEKWYFEGEPVGTGKPESGGTGKQKPVGTAGVGEDENGDEE